MNKYSNDNDTSFEDSITSLGKYNKRVLAIESIFLLLLKHYKTICIVTRFLLKDHRKIPNFIMYNKENIFMNLSKIKHSVLYRLYILGSKLWRDRKIASNVVNVSRFKINPMSVSLSVVEGNSIEELAIDLDNFAFDYDFYEYQDAVDDRAEHIKSIICDLKAGNTEDFITYFKDVIEDGKHMVPEAIALLGRIEKQKQKLAKKKLTQTN